MRVASNAPLFGMTQKYPASWSNLQYPAQRAELLALLAEAQKRSGHEDTAEMKFLMKFVFDDHDFKPASLQLGLMLLDREEADAVAAFVAALDSATGLGAKSTAEIISDEWLPVSQVGARARLCLLRQGESWFED
jgi:hypothetical protein